MNLPAPASEAPPQPAACSDAKLSGLAKARAILAERRRLGLVQPKPRHTMQTEVGPEGQHMPVPVSIRLPAAALAPLTVADPALTSFQSQLSALLGLASKQARLDDVKSLLAELAPAFVDTIHKAIMASGDMQSIGSVARAAAVEATKAEVAKLVQPKQLEVKLHGKVNIVDSPHPMLSDLLKVSQAINNVWLCGPAGSGKTTLAHQLATALGRPFGFISCTSGMSESKLLGRMNVQGTYLPASFVEIYESGGVFLLDEMDACDPNVVLVINAAMANGHLAVPDRVGQQTATRHPDCILVIATNTWGRGSDAQYSGREALDAATRDRFVLSKLWIDYAHAIETQFLGYFLPIAGQEPYGIPSVRSLAAAFATIRANITKHKLRRILSTRAFAQAACLRNIGYSDQQILQAYFIDWSEAERLKALEGVC